MSSSQFKEFYLMFMTSDYWLFRGLKKGFGHCVLLMNDGYNWMYVDPGINRIGMAILPIKASVKITDIEEFKELSKVRIVMSEPKPGLSIKVLTCVSMAKYLVGLRQCWSVTPWQFFKWLRDLKMHVYANHNIVSVEIL